MTDPRYIQALAAHFSKANPPPRLHRYRSPSQWSLKELEEPHVHIASPADMNDPFEYRAPIRYDAEKLRELAYEFFVSRKNMSCVEARKQAEEIGESFIKDLYSQNEQIRNKSGLICFSSNPKSNRLWAYYADCHRGICITYDTDFSPFVFARSVRYEDPKVALDAVEVLRGDLSDFSDHTSVRKGKEWEFEQEYRVPVGPFEGDHTRTLPIRAEAIVEVRLGVNISLEYKKKVVAAVGKLPKCHKLIQMECDYQRFALIEIVI